MSDDQSARGNFTMIPNVIFDLGLSAYAVALYGAIRRSAGESGVCTRSTTTLAHDAGMSQGMVSKAKHELQQAELIIVDEVKGRPGKAAHFIHVCDIWDINRAHFQTSQSEQQSSHDEVQSSPCEVQSSYSELQSSQGEISKIPIGRTNRKNQQSKSIPYGEIQLEPAGEPTVPGNDKPKGKTRTPKEKTAPVPISPAVAIYRHHCKLFPPGDWKDRVATAVGEKPDDLAFWEQIINAWLGLGWSPRNVKGMLDYYERRELPGQRDRKGQPMQQGNVVVVRQ